MVEVEVKRHSENSVWTYELLDRRQREIANIVRKGTRGVLLVSEVSPVITVGRRTSPHDLFYSPREFQKEGITLYPTDRGGLATYHGPGQWVVFPVARLEMLTGDRRGVRKAVEGLLETAFAVGKNYRSDLEIRQGRELGVWSKRGKVASVGIHIEKGVLLHGLAVNGFRTSLSFLGLKPCGLDAPVDFLLPEPSETEFDLLGKRLIQEILQKFWRAC